MISMSRVAVPAIAPDGVRAHQPRLTERALVEQAAAGDSAAFGALYRHYLDDVYAYIKLRVRDVDLAEDLTQDVFMNAFRGIPRLRWQGSLAPWLLRIAHNRVANHWRSLGRSPDLVVLPAEDDPDEPRPELAAEGREGARSDALLAGAAVERSIRRLTELQQQVIALRFGAGLSLSETANVMGRSTNAVKNLQHNALASLRRQLDSDEGRP